MARRRRTSVDFTTSFLDLCCCALGALILLMVLLVPIPHPPPLEAAPVVRPLDIALRLPCAWPVGATESDLTLADPGRLRPAAAVGRIDRLRLTLAGRVLCDGPVALDDAERKLDTELGPLHLGLFREGLEIENCAPLSLLGIDLSLATSTDEELFAGPFKLTLEIFWEAPAQPLLREAEELWRRFLASPEAAASCAMPLEGVFPSLRLAFFPDLEECLSLTRFPFSHWRPLERNERWQLAGGLIARPGIDEAARQTLFAGRPADLFEANENLYDPRPLAPGGALEVCRLHAWFEGFSEAAAVLRAPRRSLRYGLAFSFSLAPLPGSDDDGSLPELTVVSAEARWTEGE